MPRPPAQRDQLQRLDALVRRLSRPARAVDYGAVSTGCAGLDRRLPGGGLRRGAVAEWIAQGQGVGAGMLAVTAAREAVRDGGVLVVVDRRRECYGPALAAWGIDLARTLFVFPDDAKDEQWALDQAMRCGQAAAVLGWPARLDDRTFRRLQLAAEASGVLGLLVRPESALREPSWADVRLRVSAVAQHERSASPSCWRLRVELLRCRGGFGEGAIELEVNELTGRIDEARDGRVAAQLADPAARDQRA